MTINIENASNNLGVSTLANGLLKVRIPKEGKGKSGSFRTILVYKKSDIAIFVYGFSKNEKDNLDEDELKYFKKLAKKLQETQNKTDTSNSDSDSDIDLSIYGKILIREPFEY
jgi:hypothetical protein